jgi:hypothetical protein
MGPAVLQPSFHRFRSEPARFSEKSAGSACAIVASDAAACDVDGRPTPRQDGSRALRMTRHSLLVALALGAAACGSNDEAASSLNVVEHAEPGADWSCASPDDCRADYDAFIGLAQDRAVPLSQADLDAQVAALAAGQGQILTDPLPADALRQAILDGIGVRFLFDGIDERKLEVITTATSSTDSYNERDLLFVDPYVGTFKGILLVPKGSGPFPAVVAIHGHPESAEVFMAVHYGKSFPDYGYAILMLTMRVMAIDATEHDMSWKLLENGFTLIGLRSYETVLGLKYLRYLSNIRHDRIGLIGHSGGSSASNLTVRFEPRFKAYVSDNSVDWLSSGANEPYHCETVPALYPYHQLINDFSSSATPIDSVMYGYVGAVPGIFQFFDQYLK